jgi:exodeoxyribonuclease III
MSVTSVAFQAVIRVQRGTPKSSRGAVEAGEVKRGAPRPAGDLGRATQAGNSMHRAGQALFVGIMGLAMSVLFSVDGAAAQEAETLRVMSFNIWVGGESGGQPLEQTAKVVKESGADIIGLQEVCGDGERGKRPDNGSKIAELLGMNYFSQGDEDTAVMTRHRIVDQTPKKWGVAIELPSGRRVWLFNAHFSASPYQPYQLLKIPYNDTPFLDTAEEAIAAARETRHEQVASMLAEIKAVGDDSAVFVTGDFNEPSPLDWTEAAHVAGHHPLAVAWPTAGEVYAAGFVDAYRAAHADPVAAPGYTWTPITAEDDPKDHHDRIDFVMVRSAGATVERADIVGEKDERADIVVAPYPSDHRGVVATIALPAVKP